MTVQPITIVDHLLLSLDPAGEVFSHISLATEGCQCILPLPEKLSRACMHAPKSISAHLRIAHTWLLLSKPDLVSRAALVSHNGKIPLGFSFRETHNGP
jgi:hypothetical protein